MSIWHNIFGRHPADPLIISDPHVMGGAPVIKGTRITVASLKARRKGGERLSDILGDYPYLSEAQIRSAWSHNAKKTPNARR